MRRVVGAVWVTGLLSGLGAPDRAEDDKDTRAILDKGIKALGGEEKLSKVKAATWKVKGKIIVDGNENPFTLQVTVQGLDRIRSAFEGEFGGTPIKGMTVLAGDKGWRQFADNTMELDRDALANEKRTLYLQVIPAMLVPLKGKGFKVQSAGEEKVGGKPAVGIKVTGPEGKDFTLYFDKESGLPVKQVAKVLDFMGNEFTQETIYADYKEFQGIKKATKVENKRNGTTFLEGKITDFKVLDKVDAKTFAEPK